MAPVGRSNMCSIAQGYKVETSFVGVHGEAIYQPRVISVSEVKEKALAGIATKLNNTVFLAENGGSYSTHGLVFRLDTFETNIVSPDAEPIQYLNEIDIFPCCFSFLTHAQKEQAYFYLLAENVFRYIKTSMGPNGWAT